MTKRILTVAVAAAVLALNWGPVTANTSEAEDVPVYEEALTAQDCRTLSLLAENILLRGLLSGGEPVSVTEAADYRDAVYNNCLAEVGI